MIQVYSSQEYLSFFFKQIAIQLLAGVEEKSMKLHDEAASLDKNDMDGTFLFVGETFARICRRGSVGNQEIFS